MVSGGHARSGPLPNPNSARSDRRGLSFTALPSEGYAGKAPRWPLPRRSVYYVSGADKVKIFDEAETDRVEDRELALWAWAWTTPQAAAWAKPSESWRLHSIAMWVRTYVLCESSDATAADKGSLHRFADQIGLTPAGLRENGWQVAKDEVAERAAKREPQEPPRRRLRSVSDGGA